MNGIANGIRSAIGAVTSAASDVAGKIRSFLHFSVPDEGPLTDYESWMPDFVQGLAKSLENSRGMIQKAVQGLSSDLIVSANVTGVQTAGTTNVNFYGNYKFEDKQDIDYFMNQAALRISRKVFVYYNCVFTSTEKSNFVAVWNLVGGGTCITGNTVTIL